MTLTYICKNHSDSSKGSFTSIDRIVHTTAFAIPVMEGRKDIFYLTMHSTHFIYGYMASDIW